MKTCTSVKRETDLLILIHTDLGYLKQSMTRGGKKYQMTFIDDFSRYTKFYLLKNKYEVYNIFLLYKKSRKSTKLKNQTSQIRQKI